MQDMKQLYLEDIKKTIESFVTIESIKNWTFFITGANGLIGSFLIDILMYLNANNDSNITIIANSRSKEKLEKRFPDYVSDKHFKYYIGDINKPINCDEKVDFIVNCASNTHPVGYATDPIGTIMTNIQGTANVLDFATKCKTAKTIFLSSVEIYGENIYNIERFKEDEMGYINCNSLRAGYNEAKRCGETLCQAYIEKNGIDVSILRLPRTYGPTMKMDDSKALSQFILKAAAGEDIVLKSRGEQYFSYLYVADVVGGILKCLVAGKCGEAYNLGNIESDIRLKDLAEMVAEIAGVKVVYDLPDEKEAKGFSKATVARLDYSKAEHELEFHPRVDIENGVRRTIAVLREKR
ncbi:NAD-dependent epimerase/dehydratase family protein [Candidatus Saccharibacteria bacterium]|nr:NAD-dependent epimerase/dehydratase family protein [Candidatus Saccharibacteria bacterium]